MRGSTNSQTLVQLVNKKKKNQIVMPEDTKSLKILCVRERVGFSFGGNSSQNKLRR